MARVKSTTIITIVALASFGLGGCIHGTNDPSAIGSPVALSTPTGSPPTGGTPGGSSSAGVTGIPSGAAHGVSTTSVTGPIIARTGSIGAATSVSIDDTGPQNVATLSAALLSGGFIESATEIAAGTGDYADTGTAGNSIFFTASTATGIRELQDAYYGFYANGDSPGKPNAQFGGYYYGGLTPAGVITDPSATYFGFFEGLEVPDGGGGASEIIGDVSIGMTFTSNTVTGLVNNIIGATGSRSYDIELDAALLGSTYVGTATVRQGLSTGPVGSMTGAIFGPTGVETAGALQAQGTILGTPTTVVGGFGASRR